MNQCNHKLRPNPVAPKLLECEQCGKAEIDILRAENERMRGALAIIGNRDKDSDRFCRPLARKTLEEPE